jgi:hypothetical protein
MMNSKAVKIQFLLKDSSAAARLSLQALVSKGIAS